MEYLRPLKEKLDQLSEKELYTYIAAAFMGLIFIIILIIFFSYRTTRSLRKQIDAINTMRSTKVRQLLTRADQVKKQKELIDALIAQEPEFKLAEYIESTLASLQLSDKRDIGRQSNVDIDSTYMEKILEITLNAINMKQLVEFLAATETQKRVYIKKLDIAKSKTTSNSLEVTVTIAALFAKAP